MKKYTPLPKWRVAFRLFCHNGDIVHLVDSVRTPKEEIKEHLLAEFFHPAEHRSLLIDTIDSMEVYHYEAS